MLHIQDSSFTQSYSTHEALIKVFSTATKGYGAYAFASKAGAELLFEDSEFEKLLKRGTYSFIVGIDQITNVACLNALSSLTDKNPNLYAKAFLNPDGNSLFHPKMSFFRQEDGSGHLVIGSGNLTMGGLRKNKEAFCVVKLSKDEFIEMEAHWLKWLEETDNNLKPLDHNDVLLKASTNIYVRKGGASKPRPIREVASPSQEELSSPYLEEVEDEWQFLESNLVLITEIPKSGDRWKQANFSKETFTSFFGANPDDSSQRILFRSIKQNGSLAEIEVRPSVQVVSKNYRFELDAASGLKYPDLSIGRPIGLFIRVTTRMFLYQIIMPDNNLYRTLIEKLTNDWTGREDRMKRITSTVKDIDNIIDASLFKQYRD